MTQTRTFQLPSVIHDVERRLLDRIGRDWPIGSCLPPIKELAGLLDAGQTTTHLAVKRLAARGLLISRRGQGTFVVSDGDSDPRAVAQARSPLDTREHQSLASRRVAVVYASPAPEGLFRRMVASLARGLRENGVDNVREVMPVGSPSSAADLNADAVVYVQPVPDTPLMVGDDQIMLAIGSTVQPEIWMDSRYDVVEANDFQGAMLAGRCLRNAGCKRVMVLAGARSYTDPTLRALSQNRLRGFEAGYGETVSEHLRYCQPYVSQFMGVQALRHFLTMNPRPDGIFAVTDDAASGFQIAALAHNLSPGVDYKLIGFDGLDHGATIPHGPLATVRVPAELIGSRAAQLLATRLLHPTRPVERVELGCELFRGRTLDSQ